VHLLRLTIEAMSPISIGSGEDIPREIATQDGTDEKTAQVEALMRDANYLPTIPGGSVQGVCRHLYARVYGEEKAREVFGFENPDGTGSPGRVRLFWGLVHDAQDRAATGLTDLTGTNDAFLELLLKDFPIFRDRVALNERLSVDDARKFGRGAVPVGTRFSFELEAMGGDETREMLLEIAALFAHPEFRIGGGASAGYGRIRLIRASHAAPVDPIELRDIRRQRPDIALEKELQNDELNTPSSGGTRAVLTLKFPDGVRIGAHTPPDGTSQNEEFQTLWVQRELRFRPAGNGGIGTIEDYYPLPGSGFRGVLAHRMAFHANKNADNTINVDEILNLSEEARKSKLAEMAARPASLDLFLGHAKEKLSDPRDGAASRLIVDDSAFFGCAEPEKFMHNSIDRFTGGVRDQTGALFCEEYLLSPTAQVCLTILPPTDICDDGVGGWPPSVADAFLLALRDILTGRLPIGGRSLGRCAGSVIWEGAESAAWEAAASKFGLPITGRSEI